MNVNQEKISKNALDYVESFYKITEPEYHPAWPTMKCDHAVLIHVIDKYKCKNMLEIGTWKGYTSRLVSQYKSIDMIVTTDICRDYEGGGASFHNSLMRYGEYLKGTNVDFIKLSDDLHEYDKIGKFDLVFIDGNHNYEFVKKDYEIAKDKANKIIVFHDYKNGNPGVDEFIDSSEIDFITYEGSCAIGVEI